MDEAARAKQDVVGELDAQFAWLHRRVGYDWSSWDTEKIESIADAIEMMIDAKISEALARLSKSQDR